VALPSGHVFEAPFSKLGKRLLSVNLYPKSCQGVLFTKWVRLWIQDSNRGLCRVGNMEISSQIGPSNIAFGPNSNILKSHSTDLVCFKPFSPPQSTLEFPPLHSILIWDPPSTASPNQLIQVPFYKSQRKSNTQKHSQLWKSSVPHIAKSMTLFCPHPVCQVSYVNKHSQMELSDEALVAQFSHLEAASPSNLQLPPEAINTCNWSLCVLPVVISDRLIIEAPFTSSMIRAWRCDHLTQIESVSKNVYLVEFKTHTECWYALDVGPWRYRMDLVALKPVRIVADLHQHFVTTIDLWLQIHNVLT
jgi:Domain of unknown function (DUF4283)